MIPFNWQTLLSAVILSLVAGSPLLLAVFSCTPLKTKVTRFLPWATAPAFLAALAVPIDVVVEVPWFFMGGRMGLDEIGRVFLCLSAFIWLLASFSSRSFLHNEKGKARFLVFFLTAMAGNFGLILARGMLGYYLFFAVMSFAAYGLVVHKRSDTAVKASQIYLVLVMIGEVALFTALIILVNSSAGIGLEGLAGLRYHPFTFLLLFIGFGVKVGALPFHAWMAPAYQAAPIPAAAALAGAMVNAGILGWLRFLPLGQTAAPQAALLFIAAGALAAVYGVVIGLNRKEGGAVLACSSISQMGLMTILFGLGLLDHRAGLHAAPVLLVYVVHHSLAKSSLFFGYDLAIRQGGTLSRLQTAAMLLPALGLAGLPFTGGAIAKTGFKRLAITLGDPWYSLSSYFLPLTAMGTGMLMLHFMHIVQGGKSVAGPGRTESRNIFIVSVVAVAITLWLWPVAWASAAHSLAGMKILQALWPVAAASLLYLLWWWFSSSSKSQPGRQERKNCWDTFFLPRMRFWQERELKNMEQGKMATKLYTLVPYLRRAEKIMGRWKIIGLSYITICLILLFLLL